MADNIVYLYPDTNLFIQCRPLDQLDWSDWSEFDQVNLIVCRPVQREIDSQKNRGNDRAAKRARKTYSIFRRIIESNDEFLQVSDANPRVRLFLEAPSLPSSDLKDVLDYNKPDDEIVGCLDRFCKEKQDEDARLLTHDTGPMMTAKTHGLKVAAIGDKWLLPPENNTKEKENARLKQRITELEQREPSFRVNFLDGDGFIVDSLSIVHPVYDPLSDDEISCFMKSIKGLFPLASEFESGERAETVGDKLQDQLLRMTAVYRPATDEAISKYTDQDYPAWIDECEEAFSLLHRSLQSEIGQPSFAISILNDGARPGKDALVKITASGNFKIRPPRTNDDETGRNKRSKISLPHVPQAPQGKWIRAGLALNPFEDSLKEMVNLASISTNPYDFRSNLQTPVSLDYRDFRRDSNAFYYKPKRPKKAQESFSLECEQWRHGIGEKRFDGRILCDQHVEFIQGELSCEVHAENLSNPVRMTIPVEITIKRVSSADRARALIQDLADSAQ